jgi:hypothetical protein
LPFDRALLDDPGFAQVDGSTLSTDWVAERWDGPVARGRVADTAAVAAAMAATAATAAGALSSLRKDTPEERPSGWRTAARAAATDRWPR